MLKCIYTSSIDSKCAASMIAEYYGEYNPNCFIPIKQGDSFPMDLIKEDDDVVVIGYGFTDARIIQLLQDKIGDNVFRWYDNKKTTVDFVEANDWLMNENVMIYGSIDILHSITVSVFFDLFMPILLATEDNWGNLDMHMRLIDDFTMDSKRYQNTNAIILAMVSRYDTSPTSDLWKKLRTDEDVPDLLQKGNDMIEDLAIKAIESYE